MTGSTPEGQSVTITREFDAPIELVYEAWTNPEHVVKWMKCDRSAILHVEDWNPKPGARFFTKMTLPGVFEVSGYGSFLEVDPPNLLSYTSDADPNLGVPEMTVRVEFTARADRTIVTLTHSGIPNDQICDVINGGWTASFSQLEVELAGQFRNSATPGDSAS